MSSRADDPQTTLAAFLERAREVTRAHVRRTGSWGLNDQIAHAHSELSEVYQANRRNEGRARVLEEICDSIFSAITLAHIAGASDSDLAYELEIVFQKIERRAGIRP